MSQQHHTTFEQVSVNKSISKSPDPIHYNSNYSYRNRPYRLLHHQNGIIGNFHIRLVEGKDLKRLHWSLLGMGFVKHLGLSNAHGEVSSFGNLRLGFRYRSRGSSRGSRDREKSMSKEEEEEEEEEQQQQFESSVTTTTASASAASSSSSSYNNPKTNNIIFTHNNKTYQSSTIQSKSSPKWPSVQTSTNKSSFVIPLYKGSMPQDGMEIILSIQMKEETSTVDTFVNYVPVVGGGIISGHTNNKQQGGSNGDASGASSMDYYNGNGNGLLGVGEINLTGLVLRDYYNNSGGGSVGGGTQCEDVVDVYDEWITLSNPFHQQQNPQSNDNYYGKVRLLISYEPNGYKPQKNDIIAFESFARQPYNNVTSPCPSIIPLLHPFKIKDVKGEYILAVYDTTQQQQSSSSSSLSLQYKNDLDYHDDDDTYYYHTQNKNSHNHHPNTSSQSTTKQKLLPKQGSIRIHRNSIFVIERTNLLDNAINISLTPTDILLSTQLGQNVSDVTQPYVEAAGDILAPVILSSRLLIEAGKVGGGALAIGLKSAIVSVVQSSDPEKRRTAKKEFIS